MFLPLSISRNFYLNTSRNHFFTLEKNDGAKEDVHERQIKSEINANQLPQSLTPHTNPKPRLNYAISLLAVLSDVFLYTFFARMMWKNCSTAANLFSIIFFGDFFFEMRRATSFFVITLMKISFFFSTLLSQLIKTFESDEFFFSRGAQKTNMKKVDSRVV